MRKFLIIVGPTASGKSDLVVKVAKKLKGEVISADSRQVYKGLDIGTGKISKKEMRGVRHHLLDVANPKKQFSVSDYKILTNQAIAEIVKIGKLPIICGGTGFYIDAVTGRANFPNVGPNKLLRDKLNKLDKEELFKILKKKDPRRAREIDRNNKVRLVRALEIIEALGRVPTPPLRPSPNLGEGLERGQIWIGLNPKDLDKRIKTRLIKRIPGIIRETKRLSAKRARELGLEYRLASLYLQKKLSRREFVDQLYTAIKQYSKRQMTWFKRNDSIRWFNSSANAFAYIRKQLEAKKQSPRQR